MWTQPRATIRQILNTNSERMVFILALLVGFSQALDNASSSNRGDHLDWPFVVIVALFSGSISGILAIYLGALLTQWTGRWIGGAASIKDLRVALAWGYVPLLWTLLLWIPYIAIAGQEMFTEQTPRLDSSDARILALTFFYFIEVVMSIWGLTVWMKAVGEAQGFSAWKALLNMLLSLLVVLVPVLLLVFVFSSVFSK